MTPPVPRKPAVRSAPSGSAEERLRETRAFLQRAFELAGMGSWVAGVRADEPRRWSPEACRILGLAEDAAEVSEEAFLLVVHPEDRERVRSSHAAAAGGGVPYDVRYRVVRADGEVRWVHARGAPERDAAGRVARMIGVVQDVTEHHSLQEQLVQAQKMESVGRLAGGVAHDFNNLLTAILGYAEMAELSLPPGAKAREQIAEVRRNAERAAKLTEQLLSFARRRIVEARVLSLNDLILETDGMLRRLIGKDVELVTIPSHGLWPVKADPGQLEQVLVNMAVNSRDAMPRGGRLTIRTENVLLGPAEARRHPEASPGPFVLLEVQDTGTGMTEEVRRHIFEPFFTTKEQGKGTGLGLATCYGIVRQAGGHIAVESESGRGTTFRIHLPRGPEASTPVPPAPPRGPADPPGTETILLAEDEPSVRVFATTLLQSRGYVVLPAANGEEALRVLAAHAGTVDLLLTDLVMPRLGGRELAQRFLAERPGTPVLYMSGYTDDAELRGGISSAKFAFLPKPFTPDLLARKVREVLDARKGGPAPTSMFQ